MEKKSSSTKTNVTAKTLFEQLIIAPLTRSLFQFKPLTVMLAIGCIVFCAFAIVLYNIAML